MSLFETADSTRACFVWGVVSVVALCVNVWQGMDYDLKKEGLELTLEKSLTLGMHFGDDSLGVKVAKGERVEVLSVERTSFGQKWRLKTARGNVGEVDASCIPQVRQIVTDGASKGDTVSVRPDWHGDYVYNYFYQGKDGAESKRTTKDFYPALEGVDGYIYEGDAIAGVCSRDKFESNAVGRPMANVANEWGQPLLLHMGKDSLVAQYDWLVLDPHTGCMCRPNVKFGTDSVAQAVFYTNSKDRSAWWLKNLPLASYIVDSPIATLLVRSGCYVVFANPLNVHWWHYAIGVLLLISLAFWMFWTQAIPTLIMGWLIRFPPVFFPLSDTVLKWLLIGVSFASFYFWSVVLMAWGMFPAFALLILVATYYMCQLAISPLCDYPHIRCPKCRRLYTIVFDREEFDHGEYRKGSDVVKGRLLGQRTHTYPAWTQVTTTTTYRNQYDGTTHSSTSTHREDYHMEEQKYRTYEYIEYDVMYLVEHFRLYYKCGKCGHTEQTTSSRCTEVDRKEKGRYAQESEFGESRRKHWLFS